jgi:ATP-dependent protease ClpP protease subunit
MEVFFMSEEKKEKEKSAEPTEELKETGSANLENSRDSHRIKLLTIVGEIEGHEAVSGNTKATKYEHLLPLLAEVEDSNEIDGLLILLNTLGGDVEAGLSIAEMIASLSKPSVSWRKSFHRRPACRICGLFLYCAKRDNGHSSGALERDVYRCAAKPG